MITEGIIANDIKRAEVWYDAINVFREKNLKIRIMWKTREDWNLD